MANPPITIAIISMTATIIPCLKFSLNFAKKSVRIHACSSLEKHRVIYANEADAGPEPINTTDVTVINKVSIVEYIETSSEEIAASPCPKI